MRGSVAVLVLAALVTGTVFCGGGGDADKANVRAESPMTESAARALRNDCKFVAGNLPAVSVGNYSDDAKTQRIGIGEEIPIQYVFVLMMENRSFDSYFGNFQEYLAHVPTIDPARAAPVSPLPEKDPRLLPFVDQDHPDGVDVPGKAYDRLSDIDKAKQDVIFERTSNTRAIAPYNPSVAGTAPAGRCDKHYWRHANDMMDAQGRWQYRTSLDGADQCLSDTCHEWWCSHMQWDSGRMDGFFESNDGYYEGGEEESKLPRSPLLSGDRAMIYYDWTDIPFYYWLADNFAIGDRYHSSLLGPTYPNRDYLYGATSRGLTSNSSNDFGNAISLKNALASPVRNAIDVPKPQAPNGTAGSTIYDDLRYGGKHDDGSPAPVRVTQWVHARYGDASGSFAARYGAWYGLYGLVGTPSAPGNENRLPINDSFPQPPMPCGREAPQLTSTVDSGYGDNESIVGRTQHGFANWLAQEQGALLRAVADGTFTSSVRPQCINPVNFIDPDSLQDVNGEDEHPPASPQMGERFVWNVIQALMANPEVWKRSVLFITHDEHGGLYDHVPPPKACKPDTLDPDGHWSGPYGGGPKTKFADTAQSIPRKPGVEADATDLQYGGKFDRYGVRVPLIVVSPWAKHHYVSHYTYDHTSLLRFLESRFTLPALTNRDANADPLLDLFDFSNAPAKLAGKVPGWGGEALPPSAAEPFAHVATFGTTQLANVACRANFPASLSPGTGGALGAHPYDGYDWPPGKPPPCHYNPNADGVTDSDLSVACSQYKLIDLGPIATPLHDPLSLDFRQGKPPAPHLTVSLSANDDVTINGPNGPTVIAAGTSPIATNALPVTSMSKRAEVDGTSDVHMFGGGAVYCEAYNSSTAAVWTVGPSGTTFTPIGALNDAGDRFSSARAFGVNRLGHAAGESSTSLGQFGFRAFLFDGNQMNNLGVLPNGHQSAAYALNDVDSVAGWSDVGDFNHDHATLWKAGTPKDVTPIFACVTDADCLGLKCSGGKCGGDDIAWSIAYAISQKDWVAGIYAISAPSVVDAVHAFVSDGTGASAVRLPTMWEAPLPLSKAAAYPAESWASAIRRNDVVGSEKDEVFGRQICSYSVDSASTTTTAMKWKLLPARDSKTGQTFRDAWSAENLNARVAKRGANYLEDAIATNAAGDIVATGFVAGASGAPGPRRLYLLQPVVRPTITAPPTPAITSGVIGCFPTDLTATWSGTQLADRCGLIIANGHGISICGANGTIAADGTFNATGTLGGGDQLTISGKLDLDANHVVKKAPMQVTYVYNADGPATLTLTPP